MRRLVRQFTHDMADRHKAFNYLLNFSLVRCSFDAIDGGVVRAVI